MTRERIKKGGGYRRDHDHYIYVTYNSTKYYLSYDINNVFTPLKI